MKKAIYKTLLLVMGSFCMAEPALKPNPEAKTFVFSTMIEKERPELDDVTKSLISQYKKSPSQANYDALKKQVELNYDAVIARKVAKLEDLKKTARYDSQVQQMQEIVDEMYADREHRIGQTMSRFTDERFNPGIRDEDLKFHIVLGAEEKISIGHTPVTVAEYARFSKQKVKEGEENLPVTNVSYKDALAYCKWLGKQDGCTYRLPTVEEWQLAAGHMPKDADFNSEDAKKLTPVDTYTQTQGACGGIDFWGNVWEWTSTEKVKNENFVKGGAFDSVRMDCRTETNSEARKINQKYYNVGFRVVRID